MTRPQRIFTVATLLLVAGFLHWSLCRWSYQGVLWTDMWQIAGPAIDVRVGATGLFVRSGVEPGIAVTYGIACPVLLAALSILVMWQGRRADRARRGHCVRCNYQLPVDETRRCPECGEIR